MDRNAAVFATTLAAAIAVLTTFASTKIGDPDKEAAVAVAIKQSMGGWIDSATLAGSHPTIGELVICLESEVPLDVDAVSRGLSGTILRTIPVSRCTSETIEGNFGMFSAITNYHDDHGRDAGHLKIAALHCPNTSMCVIEIDTRGAGESFRVERRGQSWNLADSWLRWIV